jgi:HTH-type transcriptional regulator, pleiotropic regulator of extracellular virulence genes
MNDIKLGDEVKKLRKLRGLTQKQLAENICHQSEISRIEAGSVYPSVYILHGISEKLEVPLAYFYKPATTSKIKQLV